MKGVTFKERKLGRERAYGMWHPDGLIEIDPRLTPKKHLEILVHELLHELFPTMEESTVARQSKALSKYLWANGYRRVLLDGKQG